MSGARGGCSSYDKVRTAFKLDAEPRSAPHCWRPRHAAAQSTRALLVRIRLQRREAGVGARVRRCCLSASEPKRPGCGSRAAVAVPCAPVRSHYCVGTGMPSPLVRHARATRASGCALRSSSRGPQETRRADALLLPRLILVLLQAAVAAGLGAGAYALLRAREVAEFTSQFEDAASLILESTGDRLADRLSAAATLALYVQESAAYSSATFPNVTLPGFTQLGEIALPPAWAWRAWRCASVSIPGR